ncbi:AbrB/MazE/SpoVT family DNA-binding domain-containing protein [Oscillatoria sp. CS-180]|uniref:AbrB/MazE/SpoVT family DNA-binding domain-containing protein n=1 Tax=Oscillatoria sp. CS-180 TaxID=3021720 RepID=UPI00233067D0|nr:AbrB/MazE/SpoVT family DNA-binding domain-containing protein [Oscillatoria sp. CS-180]MDB9528256.1 AbrB/MazE/SpoVT family DNA-binding domain-containing protein [Oscillatoria sp. CS-180]
MVTLHLDEQGQITIPAELLAQLGLSPGAEVQIQVVGNTLQVQQPQPPSKGAQLIANLRGRATANLSTDEILHYTRDPA